MSIVSEKVEHNEVSKKITYFERTDFVRLRNINVPKSLSISNPKIWEKGYFFTENIGNYTESIYEFDVRPDDIWVISFPKCGTTWVQEMVWQICNNLNFKISTLITQRFPFLEIGYIWKVWQKNTLSDIEKIPSPRFIKSHLAAPLLPRKLWTVKPKIIYVARNAKDTMTSYFHQCKNTPRFSGDFNEFLQLFMDDRIIYTPFDSHIMNFWQLRHEENILFLTYEEMQRDLPQIIQRTANFLGKNLTANQINDLADHLSFNKMSINPTVNYEKELNCIWKEQNHSPNEKNYQFMRKGKVNTFKNEMTNEMIEKINEWLNNRLEEYKNDLKLRKIFFNE